MGERRDATPTRKITQGGQSTRANGGQEAYPQQQRVSTDGYVRLPFNPINLEYDRNSEGEKLKHRDEDLRIRGFVRAHNMDNKGNSKYNPLTGSYTMQLRLIPPWNRKISAGAPQRPFLAQVVGALRCIQASGTLFVGFGEPQEKLMLLISNPKLSD